MLLSIHSFLPRLRFALLTATLLFVLSLNHQAVATLRLAGGKTTGVKMTAKATIIKQKVTLEATTPLVLGLAPAADAWLPDAAPQLWRRTLRVAASTPPPPSAVPDLFRTRLLVAALSPHAP